MPSKKDLNYYMDYLIKLNSHQIQFDEPAEKISNSDRMFLLTHDEAKPINLKKKYKV